MKTNWNNLICAFRERRLPISSTQDPDQDQWIMDEFFLVLFTGFTILALRSPLKHFCKILISYFKLKGNMVAKG